MTKAIDYAHCLPEALDTAVNTLLDRLLMHYPDMSRLTVISMTSRGRDLLHHLVHTRIGGLLPTILSFDEYKTLRIAEATGRTAMPDDEVFLRFHVLRRREQGTSLPPADTQLLLSFLKTIAEFSVSREELCALERIASEQLERIDQFFSTMESFRASLAAEERFYPPFEEGLFNDLTPRSNEIFVGIPLMTPASEQFFRRIPHDRLFIDAPLFGSNMPTDPPDYETALSLIRRIGVVERRNTGKGISFTELAERAALPTLLAAEIDTFLKQPRNDTEQLFIALLDETLSFYLWELLFRKIGRQVNFVPWLPFHHFAAAHQLRNAIRSGERLDNVRRALVAELTTRWNELDEADQSAFEGAITLCDELMRLRPLMGDEWPALTEYLIATKKLRMRGNRSAPIQVVGMGDATGIPYQRAIIMPMNSGVFPRKPFQGPYLNLIHMPRIHRAQFEADDLALRQFLSFGHTAHIAALYNQEDGKAPSAHFSFLATEFGEKTVKRLMEPTPLYSPTTNPVMVNTVELAEQLRRYTWSFSSLKMFFTCPYRFILENIQKVTAPPCFEDEEHSNLLIGNFLHRFFAELKDHHPAIERWRVLFEELWDADTELHAKLPDHAVRRAIAHSYLADIAAWEREPERQLLFSDKVIAVELEQTATFGNGRYRLKGRIDRLQHHAGKLVIADLKYKENQRYSEKYRLSNLAVNTDSFDDRFQLLIYAYLAVQSGTVTPDLVDTAYIFLRPKVRGDYEARLSEQDMADRDLIMELIAQRLDRMLGYERFTPNYKADGCSYCPYKALCLKPDLYRAGGRQW
jgi:RecB family exonuclease